MTSASSAPISRTAMGVIGAFYFFYFVLIGIYIIYLPQMLKQEGFSATQVGIIYASDHLCLRTADALYPAVCVSAVCKSG